MIWLDRPVLIDFRLVFADCSWFQLISGRSRLISSLMRLFWIDYYRTTTQWVDYLHYFNQADSFDYKANRNRLQWIRMNWSAHSKQSTRRMPVNFNYAKTLIEKRHRCIRWPLIGSIKLFGIYECLLTLRSPERGGSAALWALLNAALKRLTVAVQSAARIDQWVADRVIRSESNWNDSLRPTLSGNLDNVEAPIHQANFYRYLTALFPSFLILRKEPLSLWGLRRSKRRGYILTILSLWFSIRESQI